MVNHLQWGVLHIHQDCPWRLSLPRKSLSACLKPHPSDDMASDRLKVTLASHSWMFTVLWSQQKIWKAQSPAMVGTSSSCQSRLLLLEMSQRLWLIPLLSPAFTSSSPARSLPALKKLESKTMRKATSPAQKQVNQATRPEQLSTDKGRGTIWVTVHWNHSPAKLQSQRQDHRERPGEV